MIKVLVVDDEPLARESIKILLRDHTEFEVVGECSDGRQAYAEIHQKHPELVFLDIQMPVMTGLELARNLDCDTLIIFTTAYHHFAVDAFEVNAIDYLLKPYDDRRFFDALQKAKDKIQQKVVPDYPNALQNIDAQESHTTYISKVIVKDPGRIRIVNVDDISWVGGAGNYVELHVYDSDRCYLHRETMSSLEAKLDPNEFIRIHRSSIVRKNDIVELRPNDKGDFSVVLKSGDELTLSRRHRDKLSDIL